MQLHSKKICHKNIMKHNFFPNLKFVLPISYIIFTEILTQQIDDQAIFLYSIYIKPTITDGKAFFNQPMPFSRGNYPFC